MEFHKIFFTNLTLLTLLSGCSCVSKMDHFHIESIQKTTHNQLKYVKNWHQTINNRKLYSDTKLRPVFFDNIIYSANQNGIITALNTINGKEQWKINLSESINVFSKKTPTFLSGGLTINDSYLYIGTEDATVFAINLRDGSIAWKTTVMGEVLSYPEVSDNLVLVHTGNGILQALNQFNGVVQWSINLDDNTPEFTLHGQSSPSATSGIVIVGGDNGKVSAIMINQGKLIWQQNIAKQKTIPKGINKLSDVDVKPLVINGVVYAVAYNGNLAALDLQSGRVLWNRNIGSIHNMILNINHLFLVDQDDKLIAININNGTNIWQQNYLLNRHLTSPVWYRNNLVVGDAKGYLYWINPNNGQLVYAQKVDDAGFQTSPIVDKNNLFLITQSKSGQVHMMMR
ncbi:Outer membrane protein assembly factor BamB [Candidatus Erwinia haradaeae]|uniref:Outer membrane protein assembly factor BamB n=2 Tax=Candidatus Erwinia haradaeae TaxID=1922217 RepID=A0A451D1Q8_9GAMM|nr:outer membrane protein assembly factor BamB [Candidatus Erwinia haradaeae]VFP79558.1 Outer membrane protein assembly factor BamB [Candidatus Erwinia haradaeae]